ncbi:MAG: V-type ATP synthase subunit I [Candidatus Altiarchaeota archaeon]
MLNPARMFRVDATFFKEHRERLVEAFAEVGEVQIDDFSGEDLESKDLSKGRPLERIKEDSLLLLKLRKLIDSLDRYQKTKTPFVDDLLGIERIQKKRRSKKDFETISSETKNFVADLEGKIKTLDEERKTIQTKLKKTAEERDFLSDIVGLDFSMENLGESSYTWNFCGLVAEERLLEVKESIISEVGEDAVFEHVKSKSENIAFLLSVELDKREKIESLFAAKGVRLLQFEAIGRPKDNLKKLKKEYDRLEKAVFDNEKKFIELGKRNLNDLWVAEELISNDKQVCEIFSSSARSRKTTTFRLWVPQKRFEEVKELIEEKTKGECILEVEKNPFDAPILLDNPPALKPFEVLTKLYGMPRYNHTDPTIFIAPTFVIFVGLMLTDFVYGAALLALGLVLHYRFGVFSQGIKDFGVILAVCGVATMFFGVMTGSYFGDFIGKYVLGDPRGSDAIDVWMDPMAGTNAVMLLGIVVVAGFLHILLGHILGAINFLRYGEGKDALIHHISWYIIVAGGILWALSRYPVKQPYLPVVVGYPGLALMLIGLILLVVKSGFMVIFDLVGIVGSSLSYARLLALVLTTAGIAMSFNFLANMMLDLPAGIGVVLALLVFLVGHIINLVINGLGAFVHSLRLQYVEFLGTYYEGDGVEFIPFKEKQKYTIR